MFTGIIETLATLRNSVREGTNVHFTFEAELDEPIKVDQSIAHNGVCLTVTRIHQNSPGPVTYEVTAIDETLRRTQLGELATGAKVNLERCLRAGQRLDGHFVQGHVDATGKVASIVDAQGSWEVRFSFDPQYATLLVPKGSICVNGVSLTVVDAGRDSFSVAIIPFTWEHTQFHSLQVGDTVNLEFDILGKYMLRFMEIKGS
jgi:riboflavin synthase